MDISAIDLANVGLVSLADMDLADVGLAGSPCGRSSGPGYNQYEPGRFGFIDLAVVDLTIMDPVGVRLENLGLDTMDLANVSLMHLASWGRSPLVLMPWISPRGSISYGSD